MKQTTACSCIPIAMNDSIAKGLTVSKPRPLRALERLEQYARKLARIVLRGLGGGNASRLLGGRIEKGPQEYLASRLPLREDPFW